ncbi:hypothetical protein B9479_008066 [Cryptococcus floricola]|uniref:Uncharacterized protein n=1 Tax=Cryptococcus floricola TaxID=2591691 RepID=A0A5D3AIK3_9TREE|nr:hypothetical protein B9479_008066 [Cryptococcus floricola]
MVSPMPNIWSEGYGTAFINSITDRDRPNVKHFHSIIDTIEGDNPLSIQSWEPAGSHHELEAKEFRKQARNYNGAMAMASMNFKKEDKSVYGAKGIYTFSISGRVYHQLGSLLPPPDGNVRWAQIYIADMSMSLKLPNTSPHQQTPLLPVPFASLAASQT